MLSMSHYPEDRGEIYGEQNEEEAAFYFSLMEFSQFVEKYGASFVLTKMDQKTFQALSEWFYTEES